MRVKAIQATDKPIDACSLAAGACYGKRDVSKKRLATCYKSGHMSVFEHAAATFEIEGISRACSHQLVRHRIASYCQESQRYNRYDLAGDDWYVMPDAFEGVKLGIADEASFKAAMQAAAYAYRYALDAGIRPEDARYLLPEATKTRIFATMNLRQLYHFFDMRISSSAQWEIRELAEAIRSVLSGVSHDWQYLISLYDNEA